MDYHTARALADSWGLVFMVAFFVGVLIWAFRPGSTEADEEAASIPFKEN